MLNSRVVIIRNAYTHDFGGGERFPVFLAESLVKNDYEPIIVSRNHRLLQFAGDKNIHTIRGWWWSRQAWNGWRIGLFPIYTLWQLILRFWYRRLFRKLRPSVVHIQSKDDFIAATMAARGMNIRIIWTDHADLKHIWQNVTTPLKNPVGKWIYGAARFADTITVVSHSELNEVIALLPEKSPIREKLTVVHNGCDDVIDRYTLPMSNTESSFSYIIASRLVTDKGIGEALAAFEMLRGKYNNVRLIVAGDGPEREVFAKNAATIESVSFVGHLDDPYAAIAKADVFLQPTYHEGFSVALVEASMLAKPIIATAVGGNVEIIHDHETGLLVPVRDAAALSKAMELLYKDTSLRNSLAQAARKQYEEQFVFDTIVKERFIPLYDKTIN